MAEEQKQPTRHQKEIGGILEDMNVFFNTKPKAISESEFIRFVLPMAVAHHRGEEFNENLWLKFANNVYEGVEVNLPNGDSFVTPPLKNKASLRINFSMNDMISEAKRVSSRGEEAVNNLVSSYLNENTAKISITGVTPPTETVHLSTGNFAGAVVDWHRLFIKYGYVMETEGTQVQAAAAEDPQAEEQPKQVSDEDFWGS